MARYFQGVIRQSSALTRLFAFKGPQVVQGVEETARASAPLFDALQPELRALRQERLWSWGGRGAFLAGGTAVRVIVQNPLGSGVISVITRIVMTLKLSAGESTDALCTASFGPLAGQQGAGVGATPIDSRLAGAAINSRKLAATQVTADGGGAFPGAAFAIQQLVDVQPATFLASVEDDTTWVLQPGYFLIDYLGLLAGTFTAGDLWAGMAQGYERPVDSAEITTVDGAAASLLPAGA